MNANRPRRTRSYYGGRYFPRAKGNEPVLITGWDVERERDAVQDVKEPGPTWDDVERVWRYLWKDERIVLNLAREGKTPLDIATVMRLRDRFEARKEVTRAAKVAKFFTKWDCVIQSLSSLRCLPADHKRALILYTRHRRRLREIAEKISRTPQYVADMLCRAEKMPERLREAGRDDVADMLLECCADSTLREYIGGHQKREMNKMDAWRKRLAKLVLDHVGKVWYVWGAQDIKAGEADCSGLVIDVLKEVKVLPRRFRDMTAQGLARHFPESTNDPKPGDLGFYGRSWDGVGHVVFHLGDIHDADGVLHSGCIAGMSGGRKYMKRGKAMLIGAGLWVRMNPRYRKNFLGWKRVK